MPRALPIVEASNKLTSLPELFEQEPDLGAVTVTRRGKPVMAVMPWELYEAILETLEIMGDENFMAALRQGIQQAQAGQAIPWEQAKTEMGL